MKKPQVFEEELVLEGGMWGGGGRELEDFLCGPTNPFSRHLISPSTFMTKKAAQKCEKVPIQLVQQFGQLVREYWQTTHAAAKLLTISFNSTIIQTTLFPPSEVLTMSIFKRLKKRLTFWDLHKGQPARWVTSHADCSSSKPISINRTFFLILKNRSILVFQIEE